MLTSIIMAFPIHAQATADSAVTQTFDVPSTAVMSGAGFQSGIVSGWTEYCKRNPDASFFGWAFPSFSCAATDYSTASTSARAEEDMVLAQKGIVAFGLKGGGGVATSANNIGGSFNGGGWLTVDLSKPLKLAGLRLVVSATADKNNVSAFMGAPTTANLKSIGLNGTYRFGLVHTWGK